MGWQGSRKEFIKEYGAFVHKATKGTGILPGTLIAQLFIESQSKNKQGVVGSSYNATFGNNYFGIKCAGGWQGPTFRADTREVLNGKSVIVNACFRKYGSIKDSILDYIDLYKKYTYKNRESYRLDYIGQVELGMGKVTDDAVAGYNLYKTDYQKFIEYNIRTLRL